MTTRHHGTAEFLAVVGREAHVGEVVEVPVEDPPHVVVGDLGGDLERQPIGDPRHRVVDLQHRGPGRVGETPDHGANGRGGDREHHQQQR